MVLARESRPSPKAPQVGTEAFFALKGRKATLQDLMSETSYEREGDDLLTQGLYLDLPAGGFHIFDCHDRIYV